MKKHFGLSRCFVFAFAATLCMPAHAMWRQAGQKMFTAVTQAVTAAARQARLSATTLAETTKNLQKTVTAPRRLKPTAARVYTTTALQHAAAVQPLSTTVYALQLAKKATFVTTAIGTGVAVAYGVDHVVTDPEIRKLRKELTVEYLNENGGKLLELYEHNPAALYVVTEFAAKNFAEVDREVLKEIIEKNPNAAEKFTEPALCNFVHLNAWASGSAILEMIMEKYPAAAQKFAAPALHHFTITSPWVLRGIMENNPQEIATFSQLALDNFTKIDPNVINVIMDKNPKTVAAFTDLAVKNFITIDPIAIACIMDKNPTAIDAFIELAVQNYQAISPATPTFIMLKSQVAVQKFAEIAIHNFSTIHPMIICFMLEENNNTEKLQKITELALQNFTATYTGIFRVIMKKNPAAITTFKDRALRCWQDLPATTLAFCIEQEFFDQKLLAKIKIKFENDLHNEELRRNAPIAFWEKFGFYKRTFDNTFSLACKDLTITEQHIRHIDALQRLDLFTTNPRMRAMAKEIIDQERDAANNGSYTFVHGQRWEYLFPEMLHTDLQAYHTGKPTNGFIYLHVRNQERPSKEDKIYKQLMQGGRGEKSDPKRQFLLFLNGPLFGNTGDDGSSTENYFTLNENVGSVEVPLKSVFDLHGDGSIYEKYASELEALKKEYDSLSNGHGNIFVITIPKKLAKDYVYLAKPGGYKKTLTINGKETDDIHSVLNTLTNHPEEASEVDLNEYCLVMVKDAMNPESGIKMKAFNVADPEKMASFWNKYENLMAKVKADIGANRAGKAMPPQQQIDTVFERYQELFA